MRVLLINTNTQGGPARGAAGRRRVRGDGGRRRRPRGPPAGPVLRSRSRPGADARRLVLRSAGRRALDQEPRERQPPEAHLLRGRRPARGRPRADVDRRADRPRRVRGQPLSRPGAEGARGGLRRGGRRRDRIRSPAGGDRSAGALPGAFPAWASWPETRSSSRRRPSATRRSGIPSSRDG